MEAQQHRPQDHGYEEDQGELVVQGNKVGLKTTLDDDPNAPKEEKTASNYQSKVTDPTGANREEVGSTPLVQSFEKMSVKEETKTEKEAGADQEGKSKSTDRGVSIKDYFAEKFKPRDEDKALSEMISGRLSGRKDKTHEGTEQAKPTEEVKKREGLGTQKGSADERRDEAAATHGESAGKSMIDRLKGGATSWLHKGGGKTATAAAQTPTSTSEAT